jgi:Domain of unknown function (DUF4214)
VPPLDGGACLLNRSVDPVGEAGWTNLLNQGVSRQIIVGVIEQSVEYRTDEVERLYQQLLNRNADAQGLNGFVNALGSGATILQVEAAIVGSPEFFQDAGGTNQGFVTALYGDLLHRAPDPGGQAVALAALSGGVGPQAVAAAVLSSQDKAATPTLGKPDLTRPEWLRLVGPPAAPTGPAWLVAQRGGGSTIANKTRICVRLSPMADAVAVNCCCLGSGISTGRGSRNKDLTGRSS